MNARGQAIDEVYGNGLWLQSNFKPLTGEMGTRQSGTAGSSTNVQNLAYVWDTAGNLKERHDLRQGLIETADYDELNRMWRTIGPAGTFTFDYDAVGNIESRSDVDSSAAWTYSRNPTSVIWTSANLPASLTNGTTTAQFAYAPDRSRWRQIADYTGGAETTLYIGGLLEKHTTPVRTHWKHLIATPSGEVQHIRRDDSTTDTFYLPSDHIGSVDAVLNASGTVLVRTSFDAWGGRRDDDWVGVPSATEYQQIANTTRRGFGGHEMLDNVGLVHMNGRVYEPASGRMLSADPFVVPMLGSQGFNRYAYVGNGPLTYADPSGFSPTDPDDDVNCRVFCDDDSGIYLGDRGRVPSWTQGCAGWCVPDGDPRNNPKNGGVEKPERITASKTGDYINVSTVTRRPTIEESIEHGNRHIAELEALLAMSSDTAPYVPTYTTMDGAVDLAELISSIGGPVTFLVKGAVRRTLGQRLADRARRLSGAERPNTVAVMTSRDGRIVVGRNQGGVTNPQVQNALDAMPPNQYGGVCAEANCIARALNKGIDVRGATMEVVNVRGPASVTGVHGTTKPSCSVCSVLLDYFGINQ